jgi:cytochrome c
VGDVAGWVDRIGQGMDTLNDHAVNGYQGSNGVMPAKGGNMSLSDDDVINAVAFMVESSR